METIEDTANYFSASVEAENKLISAQQQYMYQIQLIGLLDSGVLYFYDTPFVYKGLVRRRHGGLVETIGLQLKRPIQT